jgi:predicted amidophosphoribosyltransferase
MALAAAPWARGAGRRAIVVPVPMHRAKRRRRGVDHAALLAELVARRIHRPLSTGVLVRTRATLPQADPRVTSREANVADAFAVARPAAVAGRTVLLVDDVVTSGSTARACTAALRAAGARGVALLTAARA